MDHGEGARDVIWVFCGNLLCHCTLWKDSNRFLDSFGYVDKGEVQEEGHYTMHKCTLDLLETFHLVLEDQCYVVGLLHSHSGWHDYLHLLQHYMFQAQFAWCLEMTDKLKMQTI